MTQYHSKRKSTYDREPEKLKKEDNAASFKGLNLGYDISD